MRLNHQRTVNADEDRLIRDCKQGRTDAFGELVRLYQDRLFNTVYRLLDDAEDARDVVQEALEGLWQVGLVAVHAGGLYEYERGDAGRDAAVTALFALLEEDPVELARLLDRAAMERARSALNERLTAGYAIHHVRHHGKR